MCAIGESPRDPAPGVEPGGHEQSSIVPEGPKSTAELAEAPPSGSKVVPPAPQFEPLTAPPVPDISRDLYTRGCPVCDRLRRIAFDFLSRWQYALSTNEKVQAEFAAGLGFCHHHAWQLESVSSPVGSSVGYLQLAERIAGVLADAARAPNGGQSVQTLLRAQRQCRVCELLHEAERSYIERLAMFVAEPEGQRSYDRAQGPCLSHLVLLVETSRDAEITADLLTKAAHRFEEVAENMRAFALKSAPSDRGMRSDDEKDAYWRAITHIVGAK